LQLSVAGAVGQVKVESGPWNVDHTDIANLVPPDKREKRVKRTGGSISWPFGWPVGQVGGGWFDPLWPKVLQSRAPLASCLLIYAALQPQGDGKQRAVKVSQLALNKQERFRWKTEA